MCTMATITVDVFGKSKDGRDVNLYTLQTDKVTVRIINIGCSIKDIVVPDKDGNLADINLGYDTVQDYEENPAFLGCITGRVSNRICKGSFILDGERIEVSKNDALGDNMCHGGFVGLSRRYFDGKIDGSKLIMTYVDKDGAEGFPGDVTVIVTYELTEDSGLVVNYKATTTKPTPIDISNHFLANLAGHAAGYVGDHMVNYDTVEKIEFDEKFIPTGKIQKTEGTPMDLRKPTLLSEILDKQPAGDGLHHALVLPGAKGGKKFVARAVHQGSGRFMEVFSTEPVMIAYSAFYLELLLKDKKCKNGADYVNSGGLLFMPQGYPDAVNHPEFPSCIVRPGEEYNKTTWYKFGVV